jgi:formate dehydrogenase iron-sulfur subunit
MTEDRLDALLAKIQQEQLETKADKSRTTIENEVVDAAQCVCRAPR